ncbi:hypothetical protein LINGRAHAP2_LOCUS2359 [Linum grandiflorum]
MGHQSLFITRISNNLFTLKGLVTWFTTFSSVKIQIPSLVRIVIFYHF